MTETKVSEAEGVGTGGRIGVGIFGNSVEIEADLQSSKELPPAPPAV